MLVFSYILLVAVALMAFTTVMAGMGLLVRRAFGLPLRNANDLVLAPWIGWGLCIALLQFWHLALPCDGRALALMVLLGGAGWLWNRSDLHAMALRMAPRHWVFVLVLAFGALWLANQTTTQVRHIDTGLYHLCSVKWAHVYPIVPGLGNLRNILAYNNSYFLYAAMMEAGPFVQRSHHLISGLVLYFLLVRLTFSGWKLFVERASAEAWRVFDALLLVPLLVFAMSDYGSSPSPDVGVAMLCAILASELLRLFGEGERARGLVGAPADGSAEAEEGGERFRNPQELGYAIFGLVFLATVGVTVKLSSAVFGGMTALLGLIVAYRSSPRPFAITRRAWAWMILCSATVMAVWIVRGVITSGYPLYPLTVGGLPVDWRMPEYLATRNARSLYAWGRLEDTAMVDEVLSGWFWLRPWTIHALRQNFYIVFPVALAAAAAPLLLLVCRTEQEKKRQPAGAWWYLTVPVAALVYWFFTSPQPRFAAAQFWALGFGALALSLRRMETTKVKAAVISLTVVLFALSVDVIMFCHPWRKDIGPVRKGKMVSANTDSGLKVYVPAEGDCWDAPLPSTTGMKFLHRGLTLRVSGDLSQGFKIVGPEGR